jgi:Domain of unknown function (DUF4296)
MNSIRGIIAGLLGVLFFTTTGCSDKNSVPSGILSREKMAAVLWDMIQADQYSTLYLAKDSAGVPKDSAGMTKDSAGRTKDSAGVPKDSARINLKMETLRLYEQVFRLHQVSREEFRKSYQYYLDHPALNQVLFDSLTAKGVRMRTDNYSRPVPFRPIPQVPVPSQISPGHGPAPSMPAPLHVPPSQVPAHSQVPVPSHMPVSPFRPPGSTVKKFPPFGNPSSSGKPPPSGTPPSSGPNARDSATKPILHPNKNLHPVKKDSTIRPV